MKARTETVTTVKQMFACPECDSLEHSYGHIVEGGTFGPWYCDQCGLGVFGQMTDDGIELRRHTHRNAKTLVLLRLHVDTPEPIHIVVEGLTSYLDGQEPTIRDQESDEYFYNEHTCPWNYLGVPIKEGDDTDPHGLFQFQEAILMPKGYEGGSIHGVEEWVKLFPSLDEYGPGKD